MLARDKLDGAPAPPRAVRIEDSESELFEVDRPPPPPKTEASLSFQLDDLVIVCASVMYKNRVRENVRKKQGVRQFSRNEHPRHLAKGKRRRY